MKMQNNSKKVNIHSSRTIIPALRITQGTQINGSRTKQNKTIIEKNNKNKIGMVKESHPNSI